MTLKAKLEFIDRATPKTISVAGWSEEPYDGVTIRVFNAEQFKKLSHPTLALMGYKEYAILRKHFQDEMKPCDSRCDY